VTTVAGIDLLHKCGARSHKQVASAYSAKKPRNPVPSFRRPIMLAKLGRGGHVAQQENCLKSSIPAGPI